VEKKHEWQHILGEKNMIDSTFWEKTCLIAHSGKTYSWQHIPGGKT
jgi:hypothetical protein